MSWAWLLLPGLVLLLACGGPEVLPGETAVPAARSGWTYTPSPTSTAWPTFTPVPESTLAPVLLSTPVPAPLPASTPGSVPAAVSTPVPAPATARPEPAVSGPESTPVPEPSPTPFGKLPGAPAFFRQQSLFPLQESELPEYLQSGDFELQLEQLPAPAEVISRVTRYVVWVVVFDLSRAPGDFVMDGYVRWIDLASGLEPLVMLESAVQLSRAQPLFYYGLGRDSTGFWNPGLYRLELLDGRYELVLDWTFEVR